MPASRKPSLSLHFFALWLAVFFASPASAKIKSYALDELAPDQAYAGFAEVDEKAQELLRQAEAAAATKGTSLKDELIRVLDKNLELGVVSYIDPDGKIRITDGHHKVLATRELLDKYDIPYSKVEFSADVQGDFSGSTWEKYVKARQKEHPTYFPRSFHEEERSFSDVVAYYRKLPSSFADMKNSPMRSATGKLFDYLNLKGSSFQSYVQFELGEDLDQLGIKVPEGAEFDFSTQKEIRDAIFEGKSSARLMKIFEDFAVGGKHKAVTDALDKMKKIIGSQTPADIDDKSVASLYGALPEGTRLSEVALDLPTSQAEFSAVLGASQRRYADRVDHSKIKELLKTIRDGEELSGRDVKYLKESRRVALNLRAAIKLVGNSDAKDETKEFRNFVTELGNLDDRLTDWDFDGKMPKTVREEATEVLGLLDKGISKVDIPAKTPQEFAEMTKEHLGWLNKMLSADRITIGEYHDIRKMMRDYQGVLDLMATQSPTPELNAALAHVTALQRRMGKLKDGLEIPVDESKAAEYIERPTKIDPGSREDLNAFVAMMKNERNDAKSRGGASCAVRFRALK